ncbi:hypothetical protein KB235_09040 [Exiguobacterium alkaliphilum]|nr:hypothetical protein KB235_09040 [Exiguobacterium alkaliphilum]
MRSRQSSLRANRHRACIDNFHKAPLSYGDSIGSTVTSPGGRFGNVIRK